jgi:hypothetical protein
VRENADNLPSGDLREITTYKKYIVVKNSKRPKLPRGLRWDRKSPYIFFSWRDERGTLHQKSTMKIDPAEALLFKMRFLKEQEEKQDPEEPELAELDNLPLREVSERYFSWKIADNAAATVEREKRMFKKVLNFFGPQTRVKWIKLPKIRKYQEVRRLEISPTMKKPVTARTINYEIQLLRGVMSYAACWTPELVAYYKPLRQVKSARVRWRATNS